MTQPNNNNTWRNNLKLFLGVLSSAVVFGTVFHNVGYNNAENDLAREHQEFILKLMEQRDTAIEEHAEGENSGARADQERADDCIKIEMLLRDEIVLLKSKLDNSKQ